MTDETWLGAYLAQLTGRSAGKVGTLLVRERRADVKRPLHRRLTDY